MVEETINSIKAWAAVSPNGEIRASSIRFLERDVQIAVGWILDDEWESGWEVAQSLGWRIIRVTIAPEEETTEDMLAAATPPQQEGGGDGL